MHHSFEGCPHGGKVPIYMCLVSVVFVICVISAMFARLENYRCDALRSCHHTVAWNWVWSGLHKLQRVLTSRYVCLSGNNSDAKRRRNKKAKTQKGEQKEWDASTVAQMNQVEQTNNFTKIFL